MGGISDLFKSERGLFALALVAASTVLTALGHMTIDAWKDFNLYVFGIYALGKTVTGTASLFAPKTEEAVTKVELTKTETQVETKTEVTPKADEPKTEPTP